MINTGENTKMYIAVLDEAPDYMVPTLVAHSVLNAHNFFTTKWSYTYGQWFEKSFRKVVLRVNRREYDKIKETRDYWEGHENTICDGKGSCLVVLPVESDKVPNVLKYAKLWAPKKESINE
ncbi:hypothetical protein PJKIFABJ_00143 [Pseudomonas phage PE09]|uniref:Uncharacterized protein n=2 Tax=Otagovirus TaxID=2560197 RepID=A0A7S8BC52_9CAUD|nr:hypothetical protein QGX22_gp111 [Pseudomonas phage PE09]YP_010768430.1 hypothetical protein QGX23_gp109 [Pseudomonas phage PN09]QHZ60079.1 hypothetical protein PJKIFABJ_00143 [Pseudomonas phage PE09]QPB10543.1 hypothetical protein PN09_122 [Pseudomonas phage PN09]